MAYLCIDPGDREQPPVYESNALRTCLLCLNEYDGEEEAGYSDFACDQHPKCEGQHGTCPQSVHPQSEGNYCAWCGLERATAYLKLVQGRRPNPMTEAAVEDEGDAWEDVARARGIVQALDVELEQGRRRAA